MLEVSDGSLMDQLQLIKQLSATPTIPAQSAVGEAPDGLDSQSTLRANKEVFFFRLVCSGHSSP